MPYQLEKGPIWSVVESALAQGPSEAYALLELLRDTKHAIADGPIVKSTTLDLVDKQGKVVSDAKIRGDHLNKDWFGMVEDGSGAWQKQPDTAWDPQTNPSTGFWINYWGDVEELVRETFVRAIEVSLGLDHEQTHPRRARYKRHWPVSVFLKCPTPWFEGWVTWRTWGTGAQDGQVLLEFLVPGNYGSQVLKLPAKGRNQAPSHINPKQCSGDNGMWLITHEEHERLDGIVTTDPGTAGDVHAPSPGSILKDRGRVMVIEPAEADGGVAPSGRAYKI
jgi:hypothetical protein